jgi:hypothetical protein
MTVLTASALKKKRGTKCLLCDSITDLHIHHVKPRLLGGTDDDSNLVTVCKMHHELLHSTDHATSTSTLTKIGLAKARERGVLLGNRTNLKEAQAKGVAAVKAKADAFALRARGAIQALRKVGMTFSAIAEHFNLLGVPTAKNGIWHGKTVSNILTRPV